MIELIKSKKFKIVFSILALAFYSITAVITGSNIVLALSNVLTVVAILLFAERALASVWIFLLAELCNLSMMVMSASAKGEALTYGSTELYIIIAGALIGTLVIIRKSIKNKVDTGKGIKNKLIFLIKLKRRPLKIKMVYRIIIYSLLLSASAALAKSLDTSDGNGLTMLSSIWLVAPTFFTISTVLMVSDMYIMRLINQVVLTTVVYMQIALGQPAYVNMISTSIITLALIVGLLEYNSVDKAKRKEAKRKAEEDRKNRRKAVDSIDKIEPVEVEQVGIVEEVKVIKEANIVEDKSL